MHVQYIEQVVELEVGGRATRTDANHGFQGRPVVDQAEADDSAAQLIVARAVLPIPAHGIEVLVVCKLDAVIGIIAIAENSY